MNEIEERAELNLQYERDFCGYNLSDDMVRRAYIKGDTERKAIDIEKAKEAFNKACGWLAVYPWYNGVLEEFIKVIEE